MVTACLLDQKTRDKKARQELDREQQESRQTNTRSNEPKRERESARARESAQEREHRERREAQDLSCALIEEGAQTGIYSHTRKRSSGGGAEPAHVEGFARVQTGGPITSPPAFVGTGPPMMMRCRDLGLSAN
jgi:hypothetical protein